jgi:iron complex outermembrane recepter protein
MARRKQALLGAVCALALAMAMAPSIAFAQDTPEATQEQEIVVTATHRESSIQDVPFSVNAQTQEDIQRSGSGNLEDISRNVAGMSIQNFGPGQNQVSLRGVSAGQIIRDQPGVKEQVGIYLDDSVISLSLFTPDLDLYDLNRVETLRGPQGTLFGSGSVGGTIRYITSAPEIGVSRSSVEASINTVTDGGEGGHIKGMANIPLADNAALRFVGYHTEYAGFIDALREGASTDEDVNEGTRTGFRLAMTVENGPLTVTPRILYQNVNTDGFNRQEVFNLFANTFTTTRPQIQLGEREQYLLLREEFDDEIFLGDVNITYDFGDTALTSVTTYITRNILVSRDASSLTGSVTVNPLGGAGFPEAGALLPSNLRDTTDYKQLTQELRLASDTDSAFQWLVGAFYSDVDREYTQRLPTPGYDAMTDAALGAGTSAAVDNGFGLVDNPYHADLPYDYRQWAVFAEGSYDLTEALTVTAGARYYDFEETRRFHSGGLFSNGDDRTDSTESDGVSPRVMLRYEWDSNLSFNAQVSKGFRLGGANDPLNLPLCDNGVPGGPDAANYGGFPTYEDENLWNYEVGGKYDNGRMRFNAAAYYTDIENLQVTADAGSCSSRVVFNADAHTLGLEAEFAAELMDGLELSLAGSWVEAEFDETRPAAAGGGVLAGIRDGNRLPSVPEYQVAATLAYYFPVSFGDGMEGFVSASAQHLGSRYTQPGDQEDGAGTFVHNLGFAGMPLGATTTLDLELDPYTVVNVNAGVENDVWGLTFFVNNAFDENANLAFDRERGGRARLSFHTTTPRTVGLTLRRNF